MRSAVVGITRVIGPSRSQCSFRRPLFAAVYAVFLVFTTGGLGAQSLVEEWARTDPGYVESADAILFDSDGHVLVAGRETLGCVRFSTYDGGGTRVRVGANSSSVRSCVGVDFGIDSNDFVSLVTGGFVYDLADPVAPAAPAVLSGDVRDYILDKYNPSGGGTGVQFGGSGEDRARAVAVDGAGAVYITGGASDGNGGRNCATYRYKGSDPTFSAILDDGRSPICERVELDSQGNSIVAGVASSPWTLVVEKWIWDDGSRSAWGSATYLDTDDSSIETVTALAIDDADDIYVAGSRSSDDGATGSDWVLFKVDGSTGAVVWTTVLENDDPATDATVRAITVDGGALFATGSWPSALGQTSYLTVKLGAGDGARLCEAEYSGPGGRDEGLAIATSISGESYVTGSSDSELGNTGFATVRYAAECAGELLPELWVGRSESACAEGGANAIAVDARGDVYVAGILCTDLTAVKYRNIEPELTVRGTCPGAIDVNVSRATPAGRMAILSSSVAGNGVVPGGVCAGVEVELTDPVVRAVAQADAGGRVLLTLETPEAACGTFLQAIDESSCEVSSQATVPDESSVWEE